MTTLLFIAYVMTNEGHYNLKVTIEWQKGEDTMNFVHDGVVLRKLGLLNRG